MSLCTEFPQFSAVAIGDVILDRNAIGRVSSRSSSAALWVAMRPSIFLALASPLPVPRASLQWLTERLDEGSLIAPAELTIRFGSRVPAVVSHEGRHRMTVIRDRLDDLAVPVRMNIQHFDEADIDAVVVDRLRLRMQKQRGHDIVQGPLFEEAETDVGGGPFSGIPPPTFLE